MLAILQRHASLSRPVVSQPTQTKVCHPSSRRWSATFSLIAVCFTATAWAQGEPMILEGFGPARTAEFSPDGSKIATGFQAELSLWDAVSGQQLHTFQMLPEPYEVGTIAFSPDGKLLLGGDHVGGVTLWDVGTGDTIRRVWVPYSGPDYVPIYVVTAVAFSPDGRQFAAMRGGALTFWDSETGEMIRRAKGVYPSGGAAPTATSRTSMRRAERSGLRIRIVPTPLFTIQ